MQTNCVALAKLVVNKRLQTFRIVYSFDVHNRITVKNCVLATGDICDVADDNANVYIAQELQKAKAVLRTNNIQLVD